MTVQVVVIIFALEFTVCREHGAVVLDGVVFRAELAHRLNHQQVVVEAGVERTNSVGPCNQTVVTGTIIEPVVVHQVRHGQPRGNQVKVFTQNNRHFNGIVDMA